MGKQDGDSNFKQLFLLSADDYEILPKLIEKSYNKHMSLNAQNEIQQIMDLDMLRGIASGIAETGHYSIMADESTDVNNIDMLVICIHWLDKEITICEEYIGLIPVARIMQILLSFAP